MPAFLFDLDGTLIDSVYQHVLAWREALEQGGIRLSVWRIHRRIGMSGGLFVNALLRETGRDIPGDEAERLQKLHAQAYERLVSQVRPLRAGTARVSLEDEDSLRNRDQRPARKRGACIEAPQCAA